MHTLKFDVGPSAGPWSLDQGPLVRSACRAGREAASLGRFLAVCFRLFDQFLQRFVNLCFTGAAEPAVTDNALVVEDKEGGRALEVPLGADRAAEARVAAVIGERAPVYLLLVHDGLERVGFVAVGVHANEYERLFFPVLPD